MNTLKQYADGLKEFLAPLGTERNRVILSNQGVLSYSIKASFFEDKEIELNIILSSNAITIKYNSYNFTAIAPLYFKEDETFNPNRLKISNENDIKIRNKIIDLSTKIIEFTYERIKSLPEDFKF